MTDEKDNDEVVDDTSSDGAVPVEKYAITSFGIDFDVEGMVRRLRKKELYVAEFQRKFVWSQAESSQFIESLLLGLPVPGVFLAREHDSQKLMIIDGQQRLMSLLYFYDGFFRPDESQKSKTVFSLSKVQPQFSGRTYETLETDDRLRLDNSVIHATILKQETPVEQEDSSLYYVFGRLNSGGRKVTPQEIRTAIYRGPLIDLVRELNKDKNWRAIFGGMSARLKDEELILRFLAFRDNFDKYERPMEEFINRFCRANRKPSKAFLAGAEGSFRAVCELAKTALGEQAFRPKRSLNAAVFDSIFYGLEKRIAAGPIKNRGALKFAYDQLLKDANYVNATSKATSDETSVIIRLTLAKDAFAKVG
ncbi:DUF262 domain-containing protein [Arenimonas sp.]|uniref:DUF262 domain-containing protein n=1 Tax=Arenimonas sp. TaxID=1872635 RepID=UPI0039E41EDB